MFKCQPLVDLSTSLKPHDTVYVLVDRPSHVFLETVPEKRSFGNIWMLNGSPIFKGLRPVSLSLYLRSDFFSDSTGVLEGEQLIRTLNIRGSLRYCERPTVFHNSESRSRLDYSCLRPIITPSADLTLGSPFENWEVLSRPVSCTNNIHIYDSQWASGSSKDLVRVNTSHAPHMIHTHQLWHRAHSRFPQHPSNQDTVYYTQVSKHSITMSSSAYSITTE